jgi:hypothetical protein
MATSAGRSAEARTAFREVRELARECEAIFQAQQVDRERCGALLLFCQAAEREVLNPRNGARAAARVA